MIAVKNSAIGKVHQTMLTTLLDKVNKYAIGNTKTTNLHKAVKKGLNAYRNAWRTPWIATVKPIKT